MIILGGVRKAVGFEIPVEFDASKTFDPDVTDGDDDAKENIKYTWFCRRSDEEFTEDYLLMNPFERGSGCFKNSKYKLDETYGNFKLLNDRGSKISVSLVMCGVSIMMSDFSSLLSRSIFIVFMPSTSVRKTSMISICERRKTR